MTNCAGCAHWVVVSKTIYESGEEVIDFQARPGFGGCKFLGIDTPADFGCLKFEASDGNPVVMILARKSNAPWQNWKMGPCPDCSSKGNAGDGACHRCAGTGNVRHYDDGYVGEERTRLHPKEREQAAKPKCLACGREVERDWNACPSCGHKLDAAAAVEVVTDSLLGQV